MSIELPYAQFSKLQLSASDLAELLASAMGIDFSRTVLVTGAPGDEFDYSDPDNYIPELTPATMDVSAMVGSLQMLADAIHGQQLQVFSDRLGDATQERKEFNTEMLEQLRTANEKRAEIESTQSKKHRIEVIKAAFGVIAGVVLLVALIVATPLTGGVALAVTAAAVVGLILAVLDLGTACCANAGIEATNADGSKRAMDVSIAGGITAATELLRSNDKLQFLSDDQLKKWEMGWGTGLTVSVMLLMLVAGGKGAYDVNKLAKAAALGDKVALAQLEGASVQFEYMVRAADVVTQLGDASAGIVDGKLSMDQAQQQFDASSALALKDFFTAMADVASNQSKSVVDAITQAVKSLDDNRNMVQRMLKLMTQSPPAHTYN